MPSNPLHALVLRRLTHLGAGSVMAIGAAVLWGWMFDVPALRSVMPGLVSMKFNTALCFLAGGGALGLVLSARPGLRRLGTALSGFVALVGALTLAEYLLGRSFGIDELLHRDAPDAAQTVIPGRMAPFTALNFLLLGLALALRRSTQNRTARLGQHVLVLPVLFNATLAITGYLFGADPLYRIGPYSPMALHTGLAFFVLCLSMLAADREWGLAQVGVSDSAGGVVIRRLLPTVPLALFGAGWISQHGHKAGYYPADFQLALTVVLSLTISVLAVVSTASILHSVDGRRRQAELELQHLNEALEARVKERTQALEDSLAQVKQLNGLLPICAWCKKVRDDHDYWQTVEQYVTANTDAKFTHSICPECRHELTAHLPPSE